MIRSPFSLHKPAPHDNMILTFTFRRAQVGVGQAGRDTAAIGQVPILRLEARSSSTASTDLRWVRLRERTHLRCCVFNNIVGSFRHLTSLQKRTFWPPSHRGPPRGPGASFRGRETSSPPPTRKCHCCLS